ncbi:MAG: DUF4258 domain-containing protein [Blastocatellia bacterium]
MYERIRDRMRAKVRSLDYVMTIHAEEEMENDGLSILDVEEAVLNGSIVQRQREAESAEFKYLLAGKTFDDAGLVVVAKLSHTGKLVIITVYLQKDEYEN